MCVFHGNVLTNVCIMRDVSYIIVLHVFAHNVDIILGYETFSGYVYTLYRAWHWLHPGTCMRGTQSANTYKTSMACLYCLTAHAPWERRRARARR